MKTILSILLITIFIFSCKKNNESLIPASSEVKEFEFIVDSNQKAIIKLTRNTYYDISTKNGFEKLYWSIHSVSGQIDSLNFVYHLYKDGTHIFKDSVKLASINMNNIIYFDTLSLTNYFNTIGVYNATFERISSSPNFDGTYYGFVKINSDSGSYYKPFELSRTKNQLNATITSDSTKSFNANIYNDSLLVGKFIFNSDTLNIDYTTSVISFKEKNVVANIKLLPKIGSAYNNFSYEFNGNQK